MSETTPNHYGHEQPQEAERLEEGDKKQRVTQLMDEARQQVGESLDQFLSERLGDMVSSKPDSKKAPWGEMPREEELQAALVQGGASGVEQAVVLMVDKSYIFKDGKPVYGGELLSPDGKDDGTANRAIKHMSLHLRPEEVAARHYSDKLSSLQDCEVTVTFSRPRDAHRIRISWDNISDASEGTCLIEPGNPDRELPDGALEVALDAAQLGAQTVEEPEDFMIDLGSFRQRNFES